MEMPGRHRRWMRRVPTGCPMIEGPVKMAKKQRYRVLFIAADRGYGGSSALLYNSLKHLDRQRFEPFAAFYHYNDSLNTQRTRKLGIKVLFLDRPMGASVNPAGRVHSARGRESGIPIAESTSTDGARKHRASRLLGAFKQGALMFLGQELYGILTSLVKDTPGAMQRLYHLFGFLVRAQIDLVVLNNDIPLHVVGVLGSRLASVPCVCRKAAFGGFLIHRMLDRCVDWFIASSNAIVQECRRARLPMKNLVKVYEGVDLDKFSSLPNGFSVREEFEIDARAPVIGSIARIGSGKGHRDLLRAATIVSKRCPIARFLIVGDDQGGAGRRLIGIKQKARELGIAGRVVFAGWRDDVPNVLSAIDIFVQNPVRPEALCLAALEAMAARQPTVVTAAGGLSETTVEGVTGFIVPPAQPRPLAEAIIRLVANPELRRTMGRNARLRAETHFDIRKTMRDFERISLQLLGRAEEQRVSLS